MINAEKSDVIFSPYITLKNGRRIYARQYGKKAFCFPRRTDEDAKTSQKQ